jgi:hypothetical protein
VAPPAEQRGDELKARILKRVRRRRRARRRRRRSRTRRTTTGRRRRKKGGRASNLRPCVLLQMNLRLTTPARRLQLVT